MSTPTNRSKLFDVLDESMRTVQSTLERHRPQLRFREFGTVTHVERGIARVSRLPTVRSEELLRFSGNVLGLAFSLLEEEIGVILLDESEELQAGTEVQATGRVLDVPVSDELIGRVIDPVGRAMDDGGPLRALERWPCERDAPAIMDRLPVTAPLQTGLKVVDALIPIGRGQRELILGDRQSGKTAIAVDTIINQHDKHVVCIYCAVGQRSTAVARLIDNLRESKAMQYSIVMVAESDSPPGLQFIAPYAATTIGEYFMSQGRDVLVVYDDLTTHARAYRELSLLLRRPPGREAFPGDVFYIHSRLLERSTHLKEEVGGGSLTALPIAETEAQNVSAYIPTNLISITDGQVYVSPELFRKGILPPVDVGRSVSRVGGKAQLPAYRAVAGDLRLSYAQFEELEKFARFGSQLDDETVHTLERGRRVREVLKQFQYEPMPVPEQIAVLLSVTSGLFDEEPIERIPQLSDRICRTAVATVSDVCRRILDGERLSAEDREALLEAARKAIEAFHAEEGESNDNADA